MGLSLIDLGKTYAGGVVGVEQLNLQVEDNELVTIVGHSGSGKSTTLRLVAGLECPSSGRVCLHGRDLSTVPVHCRRVALVGQRPVLHPQWTVDRHFRFAWDLRQGAWPRPLNWWRGGISRRAARATFALQRDAVADEWGLSQLLSRRASDLSGGEQQRVAIARAALCESEAYLFDEPFSAVDQPQRRAWRERVRAWQRRTRKPMLYVTHDPAEALSLGDRVAVLRAGRVEQCGAPVEVYQNPRRLSVARAVANSPLNTLTGCWEFDNAGSWLRTASGVRVRCGERVEEAVASRFAGNRVRLGIRAEDLAVATATPDWDGPSGGRVAGRIERIERRGDCDWVSVRLLPDVAESPPRIGVGRDLNACEAESIWVAMGPAWSGWNDGDRVELHWKAARGMVFDSVTETRVAAVGNMLEEDA